MPWKWCMGGGKISAEAKCVAVRFAKLSSTTPAMKFTVNGTTAPTAVQRWIWRMSDGKM